MKPNTKKTHKNIKYKNNHKETNINFFNKEKLTYSSSNTNTNTNKKSSPKTLTNNKNETYTKTNTLSQHEDLPKQNK